MRDRQITKVSIVKMGEQHLYDVFAIHQQCFVRGAQNDTERQQLIRCYLNAVPMYQNYVALTENNAVSAFIVWREEGGFRKQAHFELKQIAVHPDFQGCGIASTLITESLDDIKLQLTKRNSTLKNVLVSTGTNNKAQRLYEKTLNAQAEAIISNYFSGDEVFMLARFS